MPGFLSVRPQDWATPQAATSRRLYTWGVAVYKSTDDGATWSTIFTPSASGSLYGVNFFEVAGGQDVIMVVEQDGSSQDVISVSTDGGGTFATVTPPRVGAATPFEFVFATSATTWIAFTTADPMDQQVYRTTDGGASWSNVTGTYAANLYIQAWASTGKIWSNQSAAPDTGSLMNLDGSGATTFSHTAVLPCVYPLSDTQALMFNGAYTPFTVKLAKVTSGTATDITPSGATVDQWSGAASADGSLILAHAAMLGDHGEVWRSTDGGSSWTQVASDPNLICHFAYDQTIAVDRQATTFWALITGTFATPGYCWVSTDSGVTWTQAGALPGGDLEPKAFRVFSA